MLLSLLVILSINYLFIYFFSVSILEFFYTGEAQANILRRFINLNANGSIVSSSELPSCSSGDRINLLSYKYLGYMCSSSNQCIRREYNLSQPAEVLIHQMCSSRDTCISRNLPSNDLSVRKVDILQVEYKCLGRLVSSHITCYILTHISLASHKWDIVKERRPR